MNLQRAIDLFLDQYKPSTRESFQYPLKYMQDFLGPGRPVDAIRPDMLVEYANTLNHRDYAPATIRKHIKAIKTFFNWLVRIDALTKTPAHAIKQKTVSQTIDRDKAMTERELNTILDYVRYKPRDHALILFLADTGCRAGGAANLTIDDIDLERCTARVTEKGEKTRPVIYGNDCARAIRIWLIKRPATAGRYVFSRKHNPISAAQVSKIVRRACKKVGVRSLGSHSLRHRKGHQLADNRVAPSVAATAMGHSDPLVTLRHYYPQDWERAEDALRELTIQRTRKPDNVIKMGKKKAGK